MKLQGLVMQSSDSPRRPRGRRFVLFVALTFLALPSRAHASFLHGETLDTVADVIAWFAFIIVPPVLIGVFLLFGGLLWPIAWLWAYSKPVLHKLAYGTDVDESLGHHGEDEKKEESEVERLRARVVELETKLSPRGGKA